MVDIIYIVKIKKKLYKFRFKHKKIISILLTLHGDKEEMIRDQIKTTTGIGGAFVLHSVQELAKVGLVEYDMDTSMVKLKKRLFPKKALEEKK